MIKVSWQVARKDLDDEYEKLRERNSALESKVKHLQETVNQPEMQNESSHSAPLDISSEHSSEFEGIGENKFAIERIFSKPKPPCTSTPTGLPCKELDEASYAGDSGYISRCSTPK